MIEAVIYVVTHVPSGRRYVGFTKRTLSKRKTCHYSKSRSGSGTKFHRALATLPPDEFQWEIIYESWDAEHCLRQEDEIIHRFDAICQGFNTEPGGGSFPRLKGESHPLFGIGHTEATKRKISQNHIDVSGENNPRAKHFRFTDPQGNDHDVYGSFKEFCRERGLPIGTMVRFLYNGVLPKSGRAIGWTVRAI